ncbi:ATP-binding cassette domain-containing protein [Pseudooceanicola sp. 216_PA32_1]|uniref:ATP-binding cassette domain-containing protein n=1 Tax=Pseudooceanicola pacificus TaxID=2676438 RepID=A0A844WED1_9RHOB|nr:ABC transporter ATP-binding protein [Pseudooceanicola pacificus]MWB78972.1 ATP-binding cassette domain-containing protein [Pseudooceanicola pacificus]
MLEIDGITAGYGPATVLRALSLRAAPGQITCLMGRNGAGKTTTMKAIMGLLPVTAGTITLDGAPLSGLPAHEVPRRGVGYIPQGRRLFGELTVAQNLTVGLMTRKSGPDTREEVLELFPRLRERLAQRADTLSGGEQQMLATARALCLRPRLLLLDEPTEGLQPSMIEAIRQVILRMRDSGAIVLLVEQRIDAVLAMADHVHVIENGRNLEDLDAAALAADPSRLRAHLGV